jgi:sec-independent protein translocase protein TatA
MRLGMGELLLIFAVLLLLFGATRLPQLGSSLGASIRNFKKGFSETEATPEDKPAGASTPQQLSSTTTTPVNKDVGSKTGNPSA